jgi:hypothetical protein
MSVELVTLDEAKNHLRVMHTEEDVNILLMIHAASSAVLNYLKENVSDWDGTLIPGSSSSSNNPASLPSEVKMAVLYLIGVFYRDRDGDFLKDHDINYLPRTVVNILYPLRMPTSQ